MERKFFKRYGLRYSGLITPDDLMYKCSLCKKLLQSECFTNYQLVKTKYPVCRTCVNWNYDDWGNSPRGRYSRLRRSIRQRNKKLEIGSNQLQQEGKKFQIELHLSYEEFLTFWNQPCFYCGSEIATVGIDRVDSKKHYTIENCVPCCTICNRMKSDMTQDAFLAHLERITAQCKINLIGEMNNE